MEAGEARKAKGLALDRLASMLPAYEQQLDTIDHRLLVYVQGVARPDPDWHNLYEILGVLKFLDNLRNYPFDLEKIHHIFRLYEGRWKDGRHLDGSGGLMFSGLFGRRYYQLTPFQVYILASLFGPHCYVRTDSPVGSRPMLDTEVAGEDGMIYDYRMLITEYTLFIPRKTAKTTMAAFVQFYYFFFGDYNAEGYCVANSQEQSKILFKLTSDLIGQLDRNGKRIRFTATEINWKPFQVRAAQITALSAGGKTKDGLFAQVCCADEFGSAYYVKNHSDMADLVNVVTGSMGPRRESLTLITTTAGRNIDGPFQIKLDGIKKTMLSLIDFETDNKTTGSCNERMY